MCLEFRFLPKQIITCYSITDEIENNNHDSNRIGANNHFVHERKLDHLAKLVKWLSALLQNKSLWVWIPLLSLKLQILACFKKEFIDIHATKECRFTLKTGMWHNSIQSIITIFMKQNYNSCNWTLQLNSTYFGNQCSVLTFQAKCRGLYSLQRLIFRTISNISDGAICKNS